MGRVKGTMVLGLVKTIRADGTKTYDAHLTQGDREFISRRILPSSWYPFEQYKRIFNVVMEVFARNDLQLIRKIGRQYGREIVRSVYTSLVIEGNPMESLRKNQIVFKTFFDFGEAEFEGVSATCGRLKIRNFDPSFERFYYILMGWNEECLELSGAKGVTSTFISRSWKGDPETIVEFSWIS